MWPNTTTGLFIFSNTNYIIFFFDTKKDKSNLCVYTTCLINAFSIEIFVIQRFLNSLRRLLKPYTKEINIGDLLTNQKEYEFYLHILFCLLFFPWHVTSATNVHTICFIITIFCLKNICHIFTYNIIIRI